MKARLDFLHISFALMDVCSMFNEVLLMQEYEDLDEYEEDGDEQEEKDAGEDEYEEEDDPKPAKEVLNYLELRQRLKEEKRKKLKKELGTANGSSREKKNVISKDVISKDT